MVYNNIINNEENFEGKDKSLLQDMLRNHLTLMPSTLEHLPLDLISIDFTELSLRYDSLDVLVATKSLCHAVEKENRIVGRYVTALKVGGIAFLALEEFDTFIHAVSGESQTHFDALIQIKEALKKLKYRVHLSNGMDFKVEIIEPFSTTRDPSRRGWAIWYERPGFKKKAFISTSPIFKFIRTR